MWIYGPDATSCVLISVPDLDYTSTQECQLIAYHAGSISHLTYYLFAHITKTQYSHTHHPASDLTKLTYVQRLSASLFHVKGSAFPTCHASRRGRPILPFRCFLASVTEAQRIVCWRPIAHRWVNSTQMTEGWREGVRYHFSKQQGDWGSYVNVWLRWRWVWSQSTQDSTSFSLSK